MPGPYIELHAASAFSFLQGASLPEALVDRAAELGYPALALLDRNGVYSAPRFHKAARAAGIKPIIGAELTLSDPSFSLPVLCESQEGYQNLCRLITRLHLGAPKGEGALTLDDLEGHTRGLVALVGRAALDPSHFGVGGLLDRLVGLFGRNRIYVELQRHHRRDEHAATEALLALAAAYRVPIVATNDVRFATPDERPLFDVLTCLHHHTDLAQAGRRLAPNAERYLKAPADMAALFADRPEAVQATCELADRLTYTMADLGYRFPEYPVPPGETQASFLRRMVEVGALDRYRPYHDRARAQIARELDLIEKLALAGYFLIVWDIVNFCRQHDILVQGRGSAANSAVCYSLGITAVDPVGMDLLFERFLSEERGEWPDIDLDLPSGDRREQVIQHVYTKYGAHGAAMTANVITYRGRSAARDVGKVLGLDAAHVDRLAKAMHHFEFIDPDDTLTRHLATAGFDGDAQEVRLFARLWRQMQDLPRHLGQHSGGMVICQGRLDAVVPLEPATMPGRVVVQWDKDDCADMGIVKVDLLGLGMMAVLQDTLALINGESVCKDVRIWGSEDVGSGLRRPVLNMPEHCGARASGVGVGPHASDESRGPASSNRRLSLADLPPDDREVYALLQAADTMGVFQVESRAQMATLPRLKPTTFYDLVVEVAIIRPGPIVGQMVHPYLNRRAGREPVRYPHPSLEPILARTLGVPLFQEQLLRIAMVAAGFTGGQAEELRRAFGFKRSERRMAQIEGQLRDGMACHGIVGEAAEEIVRSITSFALYGFPESHAASFALLAYASAYFKVHYPAAFYAALLNNQPMGFYHPSSLVKDAQRRGVRFQPIDVQISDWNCTVEDDGAIRLGLRYVHGLRQEVGLRIAAATQTSRGRAQSREAEGRDGSVGGEWGWGPASSKRGAQSREAEGRDGSVGGEWGWGPASSKRGAQSREAEGRDGSVTSAGGGAPAPVKIDGSGRFSSLDHLVSRAGVNRAELVTLADIGALNAFGYDRRSALWQAERAVRPSGELFDDSDGSVTGTPEVERDRASAEGRDRSRDQASGGGAPRAVSKVGPDFSPLRPMTETERVIADYAGTGLTLGRHPMALRRSDLALRGVLRATDLRAVPHGRRVRVAGMVITRQRPGTAKGVVFLTLEDETGVSNIIVWPDRFAQNRHTLVAASFLLVEGVMQQQDGVAAVLAEAVHDLPGVPVPFDSHDFY